ncbi:MAG: 3-oxoacyl-ACP synthase [Bacteroidia bacterium]|jgi:transcription elongation GreA/GreB family factor
MASNPLLKSLLCNKCEQYIAQRLATVQAAISAAAESGNDETKSSAGDKHETGRAMMQLEQEKNSRQLNEVMELQKLLNKINPSQNAAVVEPGSLVFTDKGTFYIAISAGKLTIDKNVYFAISPTSPIAVKLMGLKVNDGMEFNGVKYLIKEII